MPGLPSRYMSQKEKKIRKKNIQEKINNRIDVNKFLIVQNYVATLQNPRAAFALSALIGIEGC